MAQELVLASASAARKAVLSQVGLTFLVEAAAIDEGHVKAACQQEKLPPEQAALRLAELKARRVALRHPQALTIGADQILICNGRWFDKPRDRQEAAENLMFLRGQCLTLVSAVYIVEESLRVWSYHEQAYLTMRLFSESFLDAYLDRMGESITQTVGGFFLEGLGAQLFSRIDGDFFTILGLPLLPLLGFLRDRGVMET